MDAIISAVSSLGQPTYWVALLAAIAIGTLIGFIPGVGAPLVTAIMVPFVVLTIEDPGIGIILLAMVGALNNTLNSIPAVLVGLPSSETQVTYFEGHQLARQGKGAHTLGIVYGASALGGLLGAAALAGIIPIIKPFILEFGYSEIAMVALFGVAMVGLLSRGGMLKGLAAGLFGILLGTVGLDPLTGTPRFTLGQIELWQGLPLIPTILGIFALPELLDLTATRKSVAPRGSRVSMREVFDGARYALSRWKTIIRQSLFGTFMGAIPGIGGQVVDWLAYAFGIGFTKRRDRGELGRGWADGVLFSESANNAKAGGQALPTLALGVPGSASWAIIVVALVAYGVTPGPQLLGRHADIAILMVLTLAIGNLIVAAIGLLATNWMAKVTKVPYPAVGYAIMPIVFLGAFMEVQSWVAIAIVFVLGAAGLVMKRYEWPRPPLILGVILGPIIEQNLQSALSVYGAAGVVKRPITIVLLILVVVSTLGLSRVMSGSAGPVVEDSEPSHVATGDSLGRGVGEGAPSGEGLPAGSGGRLELQERATPWSPVNLKSRLLREQHIGPLLAVGAATPFAVRSLSYPSGAAILPMVAALGVIALSLAQLARQVLGGEIDDGWVMDLGMRSTGMQGTSGAGTIMAGTLALFVLISLLAGLKYGAMTLAAVGPILLLSGRIRWISAVICCSVVAVFSILLMQRFAGVAWPTPILWTWLQGAMF